MRFGLTREQYALLASQVISKGKLIFFAALGLVFVALAAILISVIQFQIRIIEAKNQSKNFSLTSLTQSVELQKELIKSVKTIRLLEDDMASFDEYTLKYFSRIAELASIVCGLYDKPEEKEQCTIGIRQALHYGAPRPVYVYQIIQKYTRHDVTNLPDLREAIEETVKLADGQEAFAREKEPKVTAVRSACAIIQSYLRGPGQISSVYFSQRNIEKSSIVYSFAWEYVQTAQMRCVSQQFASQQFGVGFVPEAKKGLPDNTQLTGIGAGATPPPAAPEQKRDLEADLAGALFFDLISYYRFYESFLGKNTELIVIAPIEISFVSLVILCGALGAMLRITAENYNPALFGRVETTEREKVSWLYYFVIGIMCSLIVYILAKTTFGALSEKAYTTNSSNLSPFVTAFLAVVSGLLCEEAFSQIIKAGKGVFLRSTEK